MFVYKVICYVVFCFLWISPSFANSPWEGKWEMGRYTAAAGGLLDIHDCMNEKCLFRITSLHGVHTCDVNGVMAIDKNHARFYKSTGEYGDEFSAEEILFELDPMKRIIDVQHKSGQFCGMRGYIDGIYEHETLPYRYPTSFDCWRDNLNQAEITICASRKLSQADVEFDTNYKSFKTAEWFGNRNKCQKDEACLWDFYKKAIKEAFEKNTKSSFNLWEYVRYQKQKWYYPTDLALLRDYFEANMKEPYFSAWTVTLGDDSYTASCENCLAKSYGIAGLYTICESAWYIDEHEMWISFVSANLDAPEDEKILVFASQGKTLDDMPVFVKEYTEDLVKRGKHSSDSIELMFFETVE